MLKILARWKHRLRLLLPLIPLTLPGCAPQAAPTTGAVPARDPSAIEIAAERDIDPAIWKIDDGDTTIYLFGTIHALSPGLGWFDEAVRDAFDEADTLVLEMVEPSPAEMMALVGEMAIDKQGVALRTRLSPVQKADYEGAMQSLNLPLATFDPMEPWMAAVSMTMSALDKAGYRPSMGVETALSSAARARGMTIEGLETPREQFGFFDDLPMDQQIAFLMSTVEKLPETKDGMKEMVDIWGRGDANDLARLMNEGLDDPRLYERLIVERNAGWTDWIEQRLKQPGTVFMAVGAGHLAGEQSVIAMLEKKAIRIDRMEY